MSGVHLGINMAIHGKNVRTSVVIEVNEHRSPSKVASVQAKSGVEDGGGKCAVSAVVIERRCVVGEIRFEDIRAAVAVIVVDGGAHACLLAPILVKCSAAFGGDVGKGAVFLIVVKNARRAVTCNVDIGPTIVVVIERRNAETVVAISFIDATGLADVG